MKNLNFTKPFLFVLMFFTALQLSAQATSIGSIDAINGRVTVTLGGSFIYNVSAVEDATNYEWIINDAQIINGQGSREIEIQFDSNTSVFNYELKVVAKNDCCETDLMRLSIAVVSNDDFCQNNQRAQDIREFNESFENQTLCGSDCGESICELQSLWSNCNIEESPWRVTSGGTPSFLTGPSEAFDGNNYIYLESSCNKSSSLRSALITLPWSSPYPEYIEFAYHMNGSDVGTLELFIEDVKGTSSKILWSKTGSQEDNWQLARVSLGDYQEKEVYFVFKATNLPNSGDQGDIALDKIKLGATGHPVPIGEFCNNNNEINNLFDLNESFESSQLCSSNDAEDVCDLSSFWSNCRINQSFWSVASGSTPSLSTGPSGAFDGEQYLYLESSLNDRASLRSPNFTLPDGPYAYYLELSYHMNGSDVGILEVLAHDVEEPARSMFWQEIGSQGDLWKKVRIALGALKGDEIYIEINARNGFHSGNQGDIAIDNISFVVEDFSTPCDLDLSLIAEPASRFWQADGSATAVVNGIQTNAIYEWSNGARTALVDNLSYGVYNVTVTDQFLGDGNCSIEGRVLVPAGGLLGGILTRLADLFEFKQDQGNLIATFENKIYPNPTNDVVVLEITEAFLSGKYSVVEIASGKVVSSGVLSANRSELTLSKYPSGNYAVVLSKDNLVDVIQIALVK